MKYLIDSDVLITAKNYYYAFDLCPGFWDSLLDHHDAGKIHSLDRNRQELLNGNKDDSLVNWIGTGVPTDFFLNCNSPEVIAEYTTIMLWIQRNPQYYPAPKAQFASGADGWLVAFAKVHDLTVVTLEESRPESRNQIKLPDVCIHFDVSYTDPFLMLRNLGIHYGYKQ